MQESLMKLECRGKSHKSTKIITFFTKFLHKSISFRCWNTKIFRLKSEKLQKSIKFEFRNSGSLFQCETAIRKKSSPNMRSFKINSFLLPIHWFLLLMAWCVLSRLPSPPSWFRWLLMFSQCFLYTYCFLTKYFIFQNKKKK